MSPQNKQASAQIAECNKILTPENKQKHDKEGEKSAKTIEKL